jgi:hypothetical protein
LWTTWMWFTWSHIASLRSICTSIFLYPDLPSGLNHTVLDYVTTVIWDE